MLPLDGAHRPLLGFASLSGRSNFPASLRIITLRNPNRLTSRGPVCFCPKTEKKNENVTSTPEACV